MSNEELMIPRYIVMVDFPQWSVFSHKKGDILELKGIHFVGKGTSKSVNESEIDKYPFIFRKLHWSENRKESDMPEYVKDIYNDRILKVADKGQNRRVWHIENEIEFRFIRGKSFIPATKKEYENQLNK
jgi:hypothetical protein